jgi:hypothetical protein
MDQQEALFVTFDEKTATIRDAITGGTVGSISPPLFGDNYITSANSDGAGNMITISTSNGDAFVYKRASPGSYGWGLFREYRR